MIDDKYCVAFVHTVHIQTYAQVKHICLAYMEDVPEEDRTTDRFSEGHTLCPGHPGTVRENGERSEPFSQIF